MPTDTAPRTADPAGPGGPGVRTAVNRHRQRELYGAPLGDRVRRLTAALGVTQARLAHALGLSPAMLSQLASGRRVKIGDPAVLARLQLLDRRCGAGPPPGRAGVDALLDEVARTRFRWSPGDGPPVRPADALAADALRGVAPPARLAAAADVLTSAFPEVADVLRRAAGARAGPPPRRRD